MKEPAVADNGEDQVLNADEAAELLRVYVQTVLKESREATCPAPRSAASGATAGAPS